MWRLPRLGGARTYVLTDNEKTVTTEHVAVTDAEALRDFVLQHVPVHRVVRQSETQLVFELREGVGVLGPPPPE